MYVVYKNITCVCVTLSVSIMYCKTIVIIKIQIISY